MARRQPIPRVDLVNRLHGSLRQKKQIGVLLETLAGQLTISQASEKLGVGRTRVHALRWRMLEGALASLAPRPRHHARTDQTPELQALQARVQELELALQTNLLRARIAILESGAGPATKNSTQAKRVRRRSD